MVVEAIRKEVVEARAGCNSLARLRTEEQCAVKIKDDEQRFGLRERLRRWVCHRDIRRGVG